MKKFVTVKPIDLHYFVTWPVWNRCSSRDNYCWKNHCIIRNNGLKNCLL